MSLRTKSLSPTSIAAFLQCLLAYWYRYFTKEEQVSDTAAMRFGSAVHHALEELGKRLFSGEPLTVELCEAIAETFPQHAAAQRISDPILIKEGQNLIRARLYKHNPNYRIVATELSLGKFNITTDKGVPLNGIVDLFQEIDPSTAVVIDYKTSRRAKTPQEVKVDTQLSMYDLMLSKLYPQYSKLWLALDFLRADPILTDRTIDERNNFEKWINGLWAEMGDLNEKDVKPSINHYCPWCGYKHKCLAYKEVTDGKTVLIPTEALESEDTFTTEYKKIKTLEKIAQERVKDLKKWADAMVEMEGLFKFENSESIITWNQTNYTSYDADLLIPNIPPQDLGRLVKFNNSALELYVSTERPDLRTAVNAAARISPSARMTVRKK